MNEAPAVLQFLGVLTEDEFQFDSGRPVYCIGGVPCVEPGPFISQFASNVTASSTTYAAWNALQLNSGLPRGTIRNTSDTPMSCFIKYSIDIRVAYSGGGSPSTYSPTFFYFCPMVESSADRTPVLATSSELQTAARFKGFSGNTYGTAYLYDPGEETSTSGADPREATPRHSWQTTFILQPGRAMSAFQYCYYVNGGGGTNLSVPAGNMSVCGWGISRGA